MKLLQPGFDAPTPPNMIEPVRLQLQGDWQAAAEAWHRATCPFYEALALAQGDDAAVERAAQILSGLKATATLDQLNKNLRAAGRSPKALKPRQSTLDNPAGLTKRQMDVLRALNDGLSNAEIGERLFIAPKTVDHHVSAIIAKLNVRTRAEAAAQARENGWI